MNGHFPPPAPVTRGNTTRLIAALLASCLVHAAAVVLPYLGSNSRESGQKSLRTLSATLTSMAKTSASAPHRSAQDRNPQETARSANIAPDTPQEPRPRRDGVDLLPVPAPLYYTTDQLTKHPQPLSEAALDTPEVTPIIASGKLILKLWISNQGEVVEVEVEKSELPEAFSRAAIRAFRQLRFAAGERHGLPVGSVMRIEVSYVDGRLPPS